MQCSLCDSQGDLRFSHCGVGFLAALGDRKAMEAILAPGRAADLGIGINTSQENSLYPPFGRIENERQQVFGEGRD